MPSSSGTVVSFSALLCSSVARIDQNLGIDLNKSFCFILILVLRFASFINIVFDNNISF